MFMLYLLRLITGYVKFRAAGRFPERFMNLCRLNGIILWDIIPEEDCYSCKI